MAKLEKRTEIRKKIILLVMAIANKLIEEIGLVKIINESVEWDKEHWQLSPGALAKALVLTTFFDIRVPISRIHDRFEETDLGYLIGENAEMKDVNATNVGRALERIGIHNRLSS